MKLVDWRHLALRLLLCPSAPNLKAIAGVFLYHPRRNIRASTLFSSRQGEYRYVYQPRRYSTKTPVLRQRR